MKNYLSIKKFGLEYLVLIMCVLFLAFAIASCDSESSNNGDGDNPSPTASPTPTPSASPSPSPTPAPGGSIIEPGGTLTMLPLTFDYVGNGNGRQSLDYYPITGLASLAAAGVSTKEAAGARPVLVWFHGGGWVINDKTNIEPIAFDIAEMGGFHLVSVGYRLAGQGQDPWPGMIREIKSAIRWLKINAAELGIDPDLIIVTGESAGAHLAAMLASSAGVPNLEGTVNPGATSDVAGAVLFYGPYEFETISDQGLDLVLDGTCTVDTLNPLTIWILLDCPLDPFSLDPLSGCKNDDLVEASPVTHIDMTDPPMFAASGTSDCFVPWMQVNDLNNALNTSSVPHEVSVTVGGAHDVETLDIGAGQVIDFLDQNIKK